MSEIVFESVALHDYPEYRDGCVEVLCEEWGRSKSARISMLEKSSQKFPYSIVLLERQISNPKLVKVVGHSRLCRVYGQPDAAFVESVVVLKKRRNQGLGRKLMEETEQHALRLGIATIYLSTHDKQDFYNHIGFEYCTPVISSGAASAFLTEKLSLLMGFGDTYPPPTSQANQRNSGELMLPVDASETAISPDHDDSLDRDDCSEAQSETESVCLEDDPESLTRPISSTRPPPPPPPTPLAGRAVNSERKEIIKRISVYWMKKDLKSVL